MKTIDIDLRDYFDDCYSGYEDFTAEITLHRNKDEQCWDGDGVRFSNDETLGWKWRTEDGRYSYGYDTLEKAVSKYVGGMTRGNIEKDRYCASRFQETDYKMNIREGVITCRVTMRYFLPEYNEQRSQKKCEALTRAFDSILMS